ncbi:MAG: glycosyltransferase [Elusimicrobiota bacterium]|jgi:glycosyltransferase involved in cell wall biosynthesis|nr:glycosyltransferase [Elusimicrobiota bacterium]
MNPKVSVLMPIYNTDVLYLKEAVESVLKQTFADFEFLIINDASTEVDIEAVIKSYKDERIKYLVNEKNLGISASRNKLIELSKGQYIAAIDHDDIALPNWLTKEVQYLDENLDFGVVSCWRKRIVSGSFQRFLVDDENIKLSLLTACEIGHSGVLIRKSVLIDNNIKYEEEFFPAEDHALFCRLIPFTNFHNINQILFHYRDHQLNISTMIAEKMRIADFKVCSFVQKDNPYLCQKRNRTVPKITYIRLFGFIPFLRIVKTLRKNKIYLFYVLLIFTYKTREKLENLMLGGKL